MSLNVQYLTWDSLCFGFKVGKLVLTKKSCVNNVALIEEMHRNNYKLIYLCTPSKIDLESFYDTKLVYTKLFSKQFMPSNEHIRSYKGKAITEALLKLAYESGKYSRFNLDERFPKELFELLYYKWLENSIFTDFSTDVLVYEVNNMPVGLLTYKTNETKSSIGIISIAPEYQGCGIGSFLMQYYESILSNDIKTLEVITQGVNHVARKFYEKFGYSIAEICYVYHVWSK